MRVFLRPNDWETIPDIKALIKAPTTKMEASHVSSRTVIGLFTGLIDVSLLLSIGMIGELHEKALPQ